MSDILPSPAEPQALAPLIATDLENCFANTRRGRSDGWTSFARGKFLTCLAERASVTAACRAAGMSAQSAYNLRNRDALFAIGWDAALVHGRKLLADELLERSLNGCVEQIHKDGAIIGERHRYDNKLSIAVLTRLDRRLDRDEELGADHLRAAADWESFVAAVADERAEEARAIIAPPQLVNHHQLHQLSGHNPDFSADCDDEDDDDRSAGDDDRIWIQNGTWRTNYPPPGDFTGDEDGFYGDPGYDRQCTLEERELLDCRYPGIFVETRREALEADEAERDALFARMAADLAAEALTEDDGESDGDYDGDGAGDGGGEGEDSGADEPAAAPPE